MSEARRPNDEITNSYVSYFAENATLLPPDRDALKGKSAIRDFYKSVFGGVEILSNEYRNPVVIVDGSLAVRRYEGTAVLRIEGEPEQISSTNRYTDVLIQQDGDWKMLWHSWVPVTWN